MKHVLLLMTFLLSLTALSNEKEMITIKSRGDAMEIKVYCIDDCESYKLKYFPNYEGGEVSEKIYTKEAFFEQLQSGINQDKNKIRDLLGMSYPISQFFFSMFFESKTTTKQFFLLSPVSLPFSAAIIAVDTIFFPYQLGVFLKWVLDGNTFKKFSRKLRKGKDFTVSRIKFYDIERVFRLTY